MSSSYSKRATVPATAAACAVTAALLLSGCGSTSKTAVADPTSISGAQSATPTPTPSPSPSVSMPPAAVLPAGFSIVVDGGTTGNPAKDAVLAANLSFYQAEYQAIGKQNADDSLYQQWTGQKDAMFDARAATKAFIESLVSKNITVVGVLRIYDEKVQSLTSTDADLTWCEDQSGGHAKNVKTGVVDNSAPDRTDFHYYESQLSKNSQGRWITVAIKSIEGDPRCS